MLYPLLYIRKVLAHVDWMRDEGGKSWTTYIPQETSCFPESKDADLLSGWLRCHGHAHGPGSGMRTGGNGLVIHPRPRCIK